MKKVSGLLLTSSLLFGGAALSVSGEAMLESQSFDQTNRCFDFEAEIKQAECLRQADLDSAEVLMKILFTAEVAGALVAGALAAKESGILPAQIGHKSRRL